MQDRAAASKCTGLVLRHAPGAAGLTLAPEGWVAVADLVAGSGGRLSEALVRESVATRDKQRFSLSDDGCDIRANQGHSIAVDLGLTPEAPPARLFHGAATRFLPSIRTGGLVPLSRQYVHLSPSAETAVTVGRRHGKPAVLTIDARRMQADGHAFFLSRNGVWLTKAVPPAYIDFDQN